MMKNRKRLVIVFFILCLGYFLVAQFFNREPTPLEILKGNLAYNRDHIHLYHDSFGKYPILKENNGLNFWDMDSNQYIWLTEFSGIDNIASNPKAEEKRVKYTSDLLGNSRRLLKSEIEALFLNPISGKFDWLAEDASGTLYLPNMPDSVLIASPPIRVVNIRCPLTASDPPFFEDFTKW